MKKLKLTQGFTIIELITVMVIIMILAGLVIGAGNRARIKAMETKAEAVIAGLEVAIGMYQVDTGSYPTSDGGSGCQNLYDDLITGTTGGTGSLWNGPYMEFKARDVSAGLEILDPWGNPYNYNAIPGTPSNNLNSFDLWSIGADGVDGETGNSDDDITNW